jgi:hypothetical protein
MKYILFFAALLLLFATACKSKTESKNALTQDVKLMAMKEEPGIVTADTIALVYYETETDRTEQQAPPAPGGKTKEEQQKNPPAVQTPASRPDWNKKIIKTASLNIEVKDSKAYSQKVLQAADRFGGYIADEQQNETSYKIENVLTIKVPVDQFQSAVDFLTTGDGKINEKKITSEDVTSQYVDTKSRLEAKRQVRLRYLDLLKQAKNMEEVLQVQSEINEIQEEIESAAGRIKYLSSASAMSTIQLTFFQVLDASAKNNDQLSFWQQTKNAFVSGWKGVGEVLIGLMYMWPLILMVAGIVWYARRSMMNKNKTATVKAEA